MAKAGLIPAYVDQVAEALAFDRALARRVRREIADHLNEAAAAFPSRGEDAERLVLADFGDPGRIAAEFAAVSVAKQTKRAAAVVIVALGAAFAAMQARLAWYAFTQWTPPADTAGIGAIVGIVDRYAFWAALFIGIGGWLYASWQPMRGGFDARYRTTIGRSYAPCLAATAPLLLCVIADGILTGFCRRPWRWRAKSLAPPSSCSRFAPSRGRAHSPKFCKTVRFSRFTASWRRVRPCS
jgi:hypothetical protein